VNILGSAFDVKAEVDAIDAFSGHADHDELLAWFDQVHGAKSRVFLVHGEAERSAALCAALQQKHGERGKIEVAQPMQTVEL
jgi:metallo-beta-lactamase family protein